VSDGAGTSGLGQTSLGTRNVGVTTDIAIYRFADGVVNNETPLDLGAYRVGDLAAAVGLSITNTAADDGFSEHLNASVEALSAGFVSAGTVDLLAPQTNSTGAITLAVDTATAGNQLGTATVAFVSDGAGTSELGQTARGSTEVALDARVYAAAVAEVQTTSLDFGIVHVGDSVAAQAVAVRNSASGALTDVLRGQVDATPAGFDATGDLGAGLVAGQLDATSLLIGLDTSTAGSFGGFATLGFVSHNAELADLDLAAFDVALNAQVNHYANPVLSQDGGDGVLLIDGTDFTLDFGRLIEGEAGVLGLLALTNLVPDPADDLRAEFQVTSGPFALSGFENFGGLAAGDSQMLSVAFDPLVVGLFEQIVSVDLFGTNASGFDGFIGTYTLSFRAEVAPVPLPAGLPLLLSGLGWLVWRRRGARCAAL